MRLLPRTLYGQILLALVAGLIAAQSLGFWLMLDDRARLGERMRGAYAAQRIAGIISILDHAEPAERGRLIRALNVPPNHLTLEEPWGELAAPNGDDGKSFIELVTRELGQPIAMQVLSIKRAEYRRREEATEAMIRKVEPGQTNSERPISRRPHGGPALLSLTGQARLSDGAVLTFRQSLPQHNVEWPPRLLGLLAVLGVSVALLAVWAVRRMTRPLAELADAAAGLARNLDQLPL